MSMIVCCCNAIRETEVRDAARTGACTVGQAYARKGCKVKCGSCLPFARAIIAKELDRRQPGQGRRLKLRTTRASR